MKSNDLRTVENVFEVEALPADYIFSNVFLHTKNYHRIHVPVNGKITRVQHIPGDLVILRPWLYRKNPSLPAFRNERINIDIEDRQHRIWHLSIVGGIAVGSIKLPDTIKVNAKVKVLDQIAIFFLGSTCCMAAPQAPKIHSKHTFVEAGATY